MQSARPDLNGKGTYVVRRAGTQKEMGKGKVLGRAGTWGPSRLSRRADTRAKTCSAVSPKGWMMALRSWYSRKRCSPGANLVSVG